jgi:ketosteroid isomerase-like protein
MSRQDRSLALRVGVAVMLAVPGAACAEPTLENSVVGTVVVELGDNDELAAAHPGRDTRRAMSQENVEVVRRWLEAISGGSKDFDRALALVHRDIVFFPPGDQPPYRGAESLRRWMEPDAFQDQVVKTFEPVVVTDRTILGRQLVMGRGAASGIELDVLTWSVWTFDEDGLITRIEIYLDHEEDRAREAAALSE